MRSAAPPPITITAAATPATIAMIVPVLLLLLLEPGGGEAVMLGLFEGPVEPLGGFAVLDPDGASVGAPLGLMTVCFVQQFGHWAAVGADPAAVPPAPIVRSAEGVATLYFPSVS